MAEEMEASTAEHIKIIVKSPKDKKDIDIERNANVKTLKDIITKEFNAELEQLCLIYAGKILKDTDNLASYGIKDGTTIHLVIKSANKVQDVGSQAGQQGSATSQPQIDVRATPFGLGSLGGLMGLSNLGFGSANFMDLQQRMQREMFTNPGMLHQLMENPLVQQLMSNPEMVRNLLSCNPQMRELIEGNPEIAHILSNPELMQQASQVALNPPMLRELVRTNESASNVAAGGLTSTSGSCLNQQNQSEGGAAEAENSSNSGLSTSGIQSLIQQMIQNPQLMTNIMQAPYMQSMLQTMAANPDIVSQLMGSNQLATGNSDIQDNIRSAVPLLSQQLANPEVQSLMGNPTALGAMLQIMQGMQQLQNEAPGILGGVRSTSNVPGNTETSSNTSSQLNVSTNVPAAGDQYGALLQQMFGMMNSGAGNSSDQTSERLYEVQLNQLASMGFTNRQANIVALTATSGDVNRAIDQLLQNP